MRRYIRNKIPLTKGTRGFNFCMPRDTEERCPWSVCRTLQAFTIAEHWRGKKKRIQQGKHVGQSPFRKLVGSKIQLLSSVMYFGNQNRVSFLVGWFPNLHTVASVDPKFEVNEWSYSWNRHGMTWPSSHGRVKLVMNCNIHFISNLIWNPV